MKNRIHIASGTLFIAILLLIAGQTVFKFIEEPALHGVAKIATQPRASFESYLSGEFAKYTNSWLEQNLGFCSPLIRTNKQISFSLFSDTRENGGKTYLGRNYWLYAKGYVNSYATPGHFSRYPESASEFVRKLDLARSYCQSRDTDLFLIVTPNKAAVYPENLPAYFRRKGEAPSDYSQLIPLLEGSNLIDGREWFLDRKKENLPYRLFGRAGIHWTHKGDFEFLKHLSAKISQSESFDLPLPISMKDEYARNRGTDRDLLNMLNLWDQTTGTNTHEYPMIEPLPDASVSHSRPVIIGDSFAWTITDYMMEARMVGGLDMFYYFNSHFSYPGKRKLEFQKEHFDIDSIIRSGDPVLIVINEVFLSSHAWGFLDQVFKQIENRKN